MSRLDAGKFVAHHNFHFVGLEIWPDGTCMVKPCQSHLGVSYDDIGDVTFRSGTVVFQVGDDDGLAELCGDVCGGSSEERSPV